MKRRCLSIVVALALVQAAVQAQITVVYTGGVGQPNIVDSSGNILVDTDPTLGKTVELGYFNPGFDVAANAGNLAALGANWHLFDATYIQTLDRGGEFAAQAATSSTTFDNKQVFLWIFKTSDNLSPPTDFSTGSGNVLEYGLFSSTVGSSQTTFPWFFPPQGSIPPANAPLWSTSDVKNFP